MPKTKDIALICFDNPFLKPMEGGKRAMLTRIKSLGFLDANVDVFLLNKPDEGFAELDSVSVSEGISLFQFQMSSHPSLDSLLKYPVCVAKRFVPGLASKLDDNYYDAIIYEGAQVASYRFEGCAHASKHILYYHDIESVYRSQLARSEKNPLKSFLQMRESKKFEMMETRLGVSFDSHLFVSCEESSFFSSEHNLRGSVRYAPYAVDCIADEVPSETVEGRILYVGDMSLDSNYRSVEWFVCEVLPLIDNRVENVELRLIGRLDSEKRKHLESLSESVRVMGYVDDLDDEYKSASCMISPILYGAGVKVKLIDALAKGQIVIANTKACEGTKLRDAGCVLVGDCPEDMARLCCDVLANREDYVSVAENALVYIRRFHSMEAQSALLLEEIG